MKDADFEIRNEYEPIIKFLQEKYGGENKASSLTEIYADNEEYAPKIKAMGRKAKELFGTTLAQYLKQIGVIGNKARSAEEEELSEEEKKRRAEEEKRVEEERKAEEEFRRKAEEERKVEEEKKRKAEEEKRLEEERIRKAEEEKKAEEERRAEAERRAEQERLDREEKQKRYELEHSVWVRHCNKRRIEREEEYKRRLKDKREELEYELEVKRDNEVKAAMEEMIKYMRQLVDAEWTLESLGLFDFKEKKAQNASIAVAEAKIEEARREIKSAREAYKNDIPGIDVKMKLAEIQIRKSVEKDIALPEEPQRPDF